MCRLLGWVTCVPATLHDLLDEQDLLNLTELSTKHGDGWGVARATDAGVKVHKRPREPRRPEAFLWSLSDRQ